MSIGGQTCIKITTRPLLCVDFSYPTSDLGRHIRLNNSNLNMTMIKNRAFQPVEVFSVFWMMSKVLQFCFSYLVFNQYPNTDTDTCTNIHTITWKSSTDTNFDTRRMPIQIPEEYQKILSVFFTDKNVMY